MLLKKRIKNELNVLKISTQEQMETEENIVKRKKPLSYSKTITKRDLNDQLYKQTPSNTQNTAN